MRQIQLDKHLPDIFLFNTDTRLKTLEEKIEEELQEMDDEIPENLVLKFQLVTSRENPLYLFNSHIQ